MNATKVLFAAIGLMTASVLCTHAEAQSDDDVSRGMMRETMSKLLSQRVTIDFDENRLEDVIEYIENVTGAEIEPKWITDRNAEGLDPDATVTFKAKDVTALTLIEMVLDDVDGDSGFSASTWQFSKYGAFEFGPRERLNRRRRVEIYDIRDLLFTIPAFTGAPQFDLNTVFQQGGGQGGGGGGQSPFQNQQQNQQEVRPYEERVNELVDLITQMVETEQWGINGGDAASIREWRGNLIINAPDYVHRNLVGYTWWSPAGQRTRATDAGQRYVTFAGITERGGETEVNSQP